jgi:hypothetical protein
VRGNSWERVHALRAAGIPQADNRERRWDEFQRLIDTWATPESKAAQVHDTTEKAAEAAYLKLSQRDKKAVDAWLDLGNNYFDALMNSGVLSRTRTTNPEDRTRISERGAREVFHDLTWRQKDVVSEWLAAGHDLPDAILGSNVLGTGEPITPREARWQALRANDKREVAEHEAAHCTVAAAVNLDVISAQIFEDGSGECTHVKGTKLQTATVRMAGELWIDQFRAQQFPYGAKGLEGDHRALAAIGDVFILRSAMAHCTAILAQNREIVLGTAAQILKYGQVVAPWQ